MKFSIYLAISFPKHHYFQVDNTKGITFYGIFVVSRAVFQPLYCCCGGEKSPFDKPAIVLPANFQQMLWHSRLALYWLSVSFFDYWPIRKSGLLLLCTELTLFCTELTLFCTDLPENCIYLNQSELSNFFMYIITRVIKIHICGFRSNIQNTLTGASVA